MKKTLIVFMFVILSVFMITGCEKKGEQAALKTVVKVNGVELHIDKESEFKGIKYTITNDLKEVIHDQYVQYYLYQEAGPNLLFFRIFYYEGKNHDYIKNDLAIDKNLSEVKGKIDNIEYTFLDTKRTDGTIHFYIIENDNKAYVINFVSQYDIKDFEKKVLDSIKF